MVQEFMILRCFSCTTFQVHQVKKSKKWACKVCGEKQSVKKVYAQGSGQDCRKHVQKLNMKCGEAQRAELHEYDGDESPDVCEFKSKNSHIALDVEDSTKHDDNDHIGLPKGESKWEKFLEINSGDDNHGSEDSVGINVTTERDVFDKSSSRGKRKSAWHHSKSTTYHWGKRYKDSTKENHLNANDMHWMDINNGTHKALSHANQNHFPLATNPKKPNSSPHTLVHYDMISAEHHNKYQSYCYSILPCGDLQSNNPQTSQNKCNIYFAKATRDPTPKDVPPSNSCDQKKATSSSSKWAKFMPSSSAQNRSHDTTIEKYSLPHSCTLDNKCNDNSRCDCQTILPSQNCSKSQDSRCDSVLAEDLFKVDDDLDEEWWNSL